MKYLNDPVSHEKVLWVVNFLESTDSCIMAMIVASLEYERDQLRAQIARMTASHRPVVSDGGIPIQPIANDSDANL